MESVSAPTSLAGLRAWVARLEGRVDMGVSAAACVPFGVASIDAALPGGGLMRGALHEIGGGMPADTGTASPGIEAALGLIAGIAARTQGTVLWIAPRLDLYAPGLAMAGLTADRLLIVEAGGDKQVLAAMEEGLRHPGLSVVIGEVNEAGLTSGRRLQLAAAAGGALALLFCRGGSRVPMPSTALTRWRVASVPGPGWMRGQADPALSDLGRAHWRLDLLRCRGGVPASWIVEASDAQGRLDLVAELADGSAASVPARIGATGQDRCRAG
jgi:protein ImuA